MTSRRLVIMAGAAMGFVLMIAVAGPADASQGGVYLKAGDTVCTDQSRSDTGVRFFATVTNGLGTATVRTAAAAGGAETVVWTATGTTTVDRYVYASTPGTYFRGCVTITTPTTSTWTRQFIYGLGASDVNDIGPNTASLSPGAWACGDSGMGPVQLTGTATASVTWYVNAFDEDYAFVGSVFSTQGSSVDTVFAPPPNLTVLEMCVLNSTQARIDASFELSAA
jgi:hypothetical protein